MRRRLAGALAVVATVALAAPAAQASVAQHTDRWLAVLEHPGDARSPALVERLLARAGVQRAGPGAPGLGVVTVSGPVEAVERLRRDPAVAGALSDLREPAIAIVAPIVERAHADGELRADFDAFDLLLTLRMVASALTDRHVDVVLRGLQP
jgi:hypothetical protein